MGWTRESMRRRPVTWFFCISLAINVAVIGVFLASGAAGVFEAAMEATGLTGRTDFVSAFRLALEAPRAIPGIALSILQPLSPDIAAFVVAAVVFGSVRIGRLVRGYRFWSRAVGWRRGFRAWAPMALVFLAMSLATASLNYLFAPPGSFGWVGVPLPSFAFPAALLASIFLDVGGVTEETGWRGFALPLLQERTTPLAASLIVGVLWGVWHLPARPDILLGAYGAGGGVLLPVILVVRFVFLSVVMTYFYNRAGGSTLIAIAMHGLHNDSAFLQGRLSAEGLGPYVVSELTLFAPIFAVACVLLLVTGGRLGLAEEREGKPAFA